MAVPLEGIWAECSSSTLSVWKSILADDQEEELEMIEGFLTVRRKVEKYVRKYQDILAEFTPVDEDITDVYMRLITEGKPETRSRAVTVQNDKLDKKLGRAILAADRENDSDYWRPRDIMLIMDEIQNAGWITAEVQRQRKVQAQIKNLEFLESLQVQDHDGGDDRAAEIEDTRQSIQLARRELKSAFTTVNAPTDPMARNTLVRLTCKALAEYASQMTAEEIIATFHSQAN